MASGPTSRLKLRLKPAAERALRQGHPWVYADSIRGVNRTGQAGELAVVYDRRDAFLGIGLYDPDSPLRVRMLHVGKPAMLDDAWWENHLLKALERRSSLFADGSTTGARLVHGENDGWPGLVLDRYDSTLVLKLYTAAWLPWLEQVRELVGRMIPHERLVLRLSRNVQAAFRERAGLQDGRVLEGTVPDGPVIFRENGLRFEAEVIRGQKTGFFLDQRENRSRVGDLARGGDVLNAFSYSGGFSLYAARGGARRVVDVDISPHALEASRRNFNLNTDIPEVSVCEHETVVADVFEWLREAPAETFDLVILDPPTLAKRAAEREGALEAYAGLARAGARVLRRGGVLVSCSCSAQVSAEAFYEAVEEGVGMGQGEWRCLDRTGPPLDHPATFPEGAYLKAIFLRKEN